MTELERVVVEGEVVHTSRAVVTRQSPLDTVKLHLVDTIDEAWDFKRWLGERRPSNTIAWDTETPGFNAYGGKRLRLIQFGDTQTGWAIPWDMWGGVGLEALDTWEGDWVLHNSRFDVNWVREHSNWTPDWSRIHDTLTQAHLDDPTRSRGLKPLAGMLIDPRAAASQSVLDKEMNLNGWTWDTVPIVREGAGSSYWIYGALDPVLTSILHEKFAGTRETYKRAYELEMGTVRAIADMERRGARVDLPYCHHALQRIHEYSGAVREWMRATFGVQSAGSMKECIEIFERLGRTITVYTNGGAKSLNKEQLQTFIIERDEDGNELPGTDLARQLLLLRKAEKQAGPYFSNFEALADEDGYVHPTIWPVGTRTARMSITDPALQTLPRGDPAVRDAFIPREGNLLMSIDADQIEMRLAAHFSQDEGLRRAFMEEPDFFNYVASLAWNDTITKGDPRRQTMKNGCYGKLYGAGVPKIALTAGVPILTMERVMAGFDANFPGIRKLQDKVQRRAMERSASGDRPYVVTPTGRRLYGDKGKEYALTNYLIQSHAAEVLKQGICDLENVGLGEYLILPVHDELVLDVPREDAPDVKHLLEETLNNVGASYFVPLTWSADVMAEAWGDKYRKCRGCGAENITRSAFAEHNNGNHVATRELLPA